jgi:hypothetical protein
VRFVIVKNDKVTLILVQLLDRLQQLVARTLELPVLIHAARTIDDVNKRLPISVDAKEFGGRFAGRSFTRSPASSPLAAESSGYA